MSSDMRIAVVGGGIAGLTVAAALVRGGTDCRVYEQTPLLGEVGAGVQVAPNAARLLHRLGLGPRLRQVAVRPAAIEMRRWNENTPVLRIPLGDECEQMYGVPYYAIHRADLHSVILSALPDGVVQLGKHCVGVEERADDVLVRFADGTSVVADVVVGADGIHSAVRDALVRDEPRFSGQTIYRGLVPAGRLRHLLAEPKVLLWLGPSQHVVCYPISSGRLVSFGATTPAGEWRTESWTARGSVDELAAAYDGWHPDVLRVLTAADSVSRWALHDRDTLDRWSSRRITIVGDAAHPMLPFMAQGANQAIEDAVVLAGCLSSATPDTVALALRRYEELRRARTAQVHQMSRRNAKTMHLDDGDEQRRRDEAMTASSHLRSQEWLYGFDAELAIAS